MEIKVYPFSYKESLLIKKDLTFDEYLTYSGMPFLYQLDNYESKINYLELLYETIIHKDIKERYNIKNHNLFNVVKLIF